MEALLGIVLISAMALPLVYAGAASARGRAATVLRWAGAGLAGAQVAAAGYLWSLDWRLAADVVLIAQPPLVAAVALGPPTTAAGRQPAWRRWASVLAAVLHLVAVVDPPAPPYGADALIMLVALALAVGVAWLCGRWTARGRRRVRAGVVALAALALTASWFAVASPASRLPAAASMAGHGPSGGHGGIDVSTLTGPRDRVPDVRVTLTARTARLTLASGEPVDAWTFNGTSPGPELRARQGELLEVTLVNADVAAGVTVHWHGLDVPNAEDGVAGLTQDAVRPGGRRAYRFVAEQAGTFWYHSHQQSDRQVRRGLFGAIVIEPAMPVAEEDLTVVAHAWPTASGRPTALTVTGGPPSTGVTRRQVPPGTRVRLRLVNADNEPRGFALADTPFRVVAIDGTDLPAPAQLADRQLLVGGGGRYDVAFTMPSGTVRLALTRDDNHDGGALPGLVLSPSGEGGDLRPPGDVPVLDPARYGSGGDAERRRFTAPAFTRTFTLVLGESFTFFDGIFGQYPTINGRLYPNTPVLSVRRGDLVKVTFLSRSFEDHPMHLHGHHMLVLSRNGSPATGGAWWTDTLNVAPGERYDVAFRADNPGLWMDHCHNLEHAAEGMTLHLAYQGYRTSYRVGSGTGNEPE